MAIAMHRCNSATLPEADSEGPPSILNDGRLLMLWLRKLVKTDFFVPCDEHSHLKKNERIYYCMTCGDGNSMCRHCLGGHEEHYVVQMRRYVYNDVVNLSEISLFVDTSGIQSYSINAAPVIFVKQRPHNHDSKQSSKDSCVICRRSLKEGHSFCSLQCKVESAADWGDDIQSLLPENTNVDCLPKVAKPVPQTKRSEKAATNPRKRQQRSESPIHVTSSDKEDSSSECSAQTGMKRSCSRGRSPTSSRRKQAHPRQSPPI